MRRTVNIGNTAKVEGKADFMVLISAGKDSAPAVEGVSFVSGEEKLKPLSEVLRSAKYIQKFPDDTPVKILRRGTLWCKADGACSLVLASPEDARAGE